MNDLQILLMVYNGERTISKVLRSFDQASAIFVFIDKKTNDKTVDEIKHLKQKNVKIRYFTFTSFCDSRNLIISKCQDYKYTMFVDDSYVFVGNYTQFVEEVLYLNKDLVAITVKDSISSYKRNIIFKTKVGYYIGKIHEFINKPQEGFVKSAFLWDVSTNTNRTIERIDNDIVLLSENKSPRNIFLTALAHLKDYNSNKNKESLQKAIDKFKERIKYKENPEELFYTYLCLGHITQEREKYYLESIDVYKERNGESYYYLFLLTKNLKYLEQAYKYKTHGYHEYPMDENVYKQIEKYYNALFV